MVVHELILLVVGTIKSRVNHPSCFSSLRALIIRIKLEFHIAKITRRLLVTITLNLILSTDFQRMQQRRVLDKPIRSPDPDAPCQEFPNKNNLTFKKNGATQLYICHMMADGCSVGQSNKKIFGAYFKLARFFKKVGQRHVSKSFVVLPLSVSVKIYRF